MDNGVGSGGGQSIAAHGDSLTDDEAYHLLRRAAFGATPEQVARAVQRGLTATVDQLLQIRSVPASITALTETYEDDVAKRWPVHMIDGPNPLLENMTLFWHDRFATSRRIVMPRTGASARNSPSDRPT